MTYDKNNRDTCDPLNTTCPAQTSRLEIGAEINNIGDMYNISSSLLERASGFVSKKEDVFFLCITREGAGRLGRDTSTSEIRQGTRPKQHFSLCSQSLARAGQMDGTVWVSKGGDEMTRTRALRQPTDDEYRGYDGMHCRGLWRALPEDWRCPSCLRTKRGLLRWGLRQGHNAVRYGRTGWKAALAKHHDHEPDGGGDFSGVKGRFPATIICGDCNAADAHAKRMVGAPSWFSFSPAELRQFISAADNGPATINIEIAGRMARQKSAAWIG